MAFFLTCLLGLQPLVLRFLLRMGSRLLGKPVPPFTLGYRRMALLLLWYGLVNAANGVAFVLVGAAASPPPRGSWVPLASAYRVATWSVTSASSPPAG